MDTSSFDIVGLCIEAGFGLLIFSLFVGLSIELLFEDLVTLYAALSGRDFERETLEDGSTRTRLNPARSGKQPKGEKGL